MKNNQNFHFINIPPEIHTPQKLREQRRNPNCFRFFDGPYLCEKFLFRNVKKNHFQARGPYFSNQWIEHFGRPWFQRHLPKNVEILFFFLGLYWIRIFFSIKRSHGPESQIEQERALLFSTQDISRINGCIENLKTV